MVWFHGGDFNTGTPAIWNASIFVSRQKVSYSTNILDSKNSKITIFHPLHNLDFKNDHINICNNYYEITCTGCFNYLTIKDRKLSCKWDENLNVCVCVCSFLQFFQILFFNKPRFYYFYIGRTFCDWQAMLWPYILYIL